jgi:hypothetical protein
VTLSKELFVLGSETGNEAKGCVSVLDILDEAGPYSLGISNVGGTSRFCRLGLGGLISSPEDESAPKSPPTTALSESFSVMESLPALPVSALDPRSSLGSGNGFAL